MSWNRSNALTIRIADRGYGRARVRVQAIEVESAAWAMATRTLVVRAAETDAAKKAKPAAGMGLFADLAAVGHAAPSPRPRVVSLM